MRCRLTQRLHLIGLGHDSSDLHLTNDSLCPMRSLLRVIWQDIHRLDAFLGPTARVFALLFPAGLIVFAWWLGSEWWNTPITIRPNFIERRSTRGILTLVVLGAVFASYLSWVVDRVRR